MKYTAITVYGIPNCDSVKKARMWLSDHGVDYVFHDFKKQGVPPEAVDLWLKHMSWDVLVNRKGTTWRKIDPALQAGVTDAASARALMRMLMSLDTSTTSRAGYFLRSASTTPRIWLSALPWGRLVGRE